MTNIRLFRFDLSVQIEFPAVKTGVSCQSHFKACFLTVLSLWVHKVFPALLLIDQKGTYKYTCEWRWMDYEIGNNNEPLRQRNSSSWHPRLIFPALFIPAQI